MRFLELLEGRRSWKQYRGTCHQLRLVRRDTDDGSGFEPLECEASFGLVLTGRTETFAAYYVHIGPPDGLGDGWLAEHRHSLYEAFQEVCEAAETAGWRVLALGRTAQFKETGLSVNSGYGYHPAIPDRATHMSEFADFDSTAANPQ